MKKILTKQEREDAMGDLLGIAFIIFLIVIGIMFSMGIVSATNGTGTINLSESNITLNPNLLKVSGNFSIFGNLNVSGRLYLGELIEGNFTIKSITIGTERNASGFLEDAIQMTSYEGDFYKHPELNLTSEVTYASFIASERFLNESECVKLYVVGTRVELVELEKKWWQFWKNKDKLVFNPIVAYVCEQKVNEVRYYP